MPTSLSTTPSTSFHPTTHPFIMGTAMVCFALVYAAGCGTTLLTLLLWNMTTTSPHTRDGGGIGTTERPTVVEEDPIFKVFKNLSHDDPQLLTYIRKFHIQPPSVLNGSNGSSYKLTKPIEPVPTTLLRALQRKVGLKKMRHGFFVECGAHDGEFQSNTLALEHHFGWKGLLIEPSPTFFSKLKSKGRIGSTFSDVCLSSRPEKVELFRNIVGNPGGSRLKHEGNTRFLQGDHVSDGHVDCFPLATVLRAINVSSVDFLSLDVEGNEYKVLSVFPFKEIEIKVIQVEHLNVPEGEETLQKLLEDNGYELRLPSPPSGWDYIFAKK